MTTPIILAPTGLRAFHNDPVVREKYIARVHDHRAADEIVQGLYTEKYGKGKLRGCAVGCTIHSDRHEDYETELGIPRWLARIEDRLFEMMPIENAKEWPLKFLSAIPLGADLDGVYPKFVGWMLADPETGSIARLKKHNAGEKIIALVQEVADGYTTGSLTRERGRELADAIYAERRALWVIYDEKRRIADAAWSRRAAAAAAAAAEAAEAAAAEAAAEAEAAAAAAAAAGEAEAAAEAEAAEAAAAEAAEAAAEEAAAEEEAAEAEAAAEAAAEEAAEEAAFWSGRAWAYGRSRFALAAGERLLVLLAEAPIPAEAA